jgi:type 1 fimbria pilin
MTKFPAYWLPWAMISLGCVFDVAVAQSTVHFNVTGSIVNEGTCTFQNTEVPVPLGDVNKSVFTGVGTPSPWLEFKLVSAGCTDVSHVYMKYSGTAASGNSNLFAVTGGAAGVGVDIQTYNDQQAVPNGATITWAPRAIGATYDFKARYMQTQSSITAGVANTTVTVSMTYD